MILCFSAPKMNYVGNVSILDRGDAPAQAVLDRTARSLAQRVADETRDELEKVMTRVDHVSFEFWLNSSTRLKSIGTKF